MLAHPRDGTQRIILLFCSFSRLHISDLCTCSNITSPDEESLDLSQETLTLGTDLRYFDETLATSLLPAGPLFNSNRTVLCPLFPVG